MNNHNDGDDVSPPFAVIEGGLSKSASSAAGENTAQSPKPPPGANLTTQERRVWEYICESLQMAGVEHLTAGLTIKIICRTWMDWIKHLDQCDKEGRFGQSEKGHRYELPHSYTEKQLKKDLLRWLPEACLTIPSLVSARAKLGQVNLQDDLFGDLVSQATSDRKNTQAA